MVSIERPGSLVRGHTCGGINETILADELRASKTIASRRSSPIDAFLVLDQWGDALRSTRSSFIDQPGYSSVAGDRWLDGYDAGGTLL